MLTETPTCSPELKTFPAFRPIHPFTVCPHCFIVLLESLRKFRYTT